MLDKQADASFWQDNKKATAIIKETNNTKKLIDDYTQLDHCLNGLVESINSLNKDYDSDLFELVLEDYYVCSAF